MKLALYLVVIKNAKHVPTTCSKATVLTRNPSCKLVPMQSRRQSPPIPSLSLHWGYGRSALNP